MLCFWQAFWTVRAKSVQNFLGRFAAVSVSLSFQDLNVPSAQTRAKRKEN